MRIDTILISAQHSKDTDIYTPQKDILEKVVFEVVEPDMIDIEIKSYINPNGGDIVWKK